MTEMFGPYRLDGLLGRGGMGEVHRAHDTRKRDRVVALKLLPAHLSADEEFRARFQREAEIAAVLREPHIIPIHDYGEIDGRLYLDMRLVDGVDLATVIKRDGPLVPERAVAIVEQVAAALDIAHADGLIHRDVKPSNILVTPGPPEFVYLVDFGIAQDARATARGWITASGATVGTLTYMAPERFLDDDIDHRVDVYALACVLFEALTGRPPFTGDQPALMHGHITRSVPRLTEHRVGPMEDLDDVIARGMAKNPIDRYPTAGALAAAAQAAIMSPVATTPTLTPVSPDGIVASTAALLARPGLGLAPTQLPAQHPSPAVRRHDTPARRAPAPPYGSASPKPRRIYWWIAAALVVLTLIVIGLAAKLPSTPERILRGHAGAVTAVTAALLNDRPVIVSGSADDTIRIWDLATGAPIGPPLVGHTDTVDSIDTTTVGDRPVIVSGSLDGTRRVWDLATGMPVGDTLIGHKEGVLAVATARVNDYPIIVSGSADSSVRVGNLETSTLVGRPLIGHIGPVLAVATAQLGDRAVVISAGNDDTIRVWDLPTGAPVGSVISGHMGAVTGLAVARFSGKMIVVCSGADRTIRIWDLLTGTPVGEPLIGHTDVVNAVAITDLDGRTVVVSGSGDGTIRTWDLTAIAGL